MSEWTLNVNPQVFDGRNDFIRDNLISGFTPGDNHTIRCLFTLPDEIQRLQETTSKAYLYVHKHPLNTDDVAVFHIDITTTDTANVGWVDNKDSSWYWVELRFDISSANSALLNPQQDYYYSIRCISSTGKPFTKYIGILRTSFGATKETS